MSMTKMDKPSTLVFSFLSRLLIIFHFVIKGQGTNYTYYCQEEFKCGNLGNVSYPFTTPSTPNCGLWILDCKIATPRIDLGVGINDPVELWPTIVSHTSNQIQMEVPKSCLVLQNDIPTDGGVVVDIAPKPTNVLYCDQTSSQSNVLLANYSKFDLCQADYGFTMYYNYSDGRISNYSWIVPNGCSERRLSLENKQLEKDGNFFYILAREVALTWTVTGNSPCKECFEQGHECRIFDYSTDFNVTCIDNRKENEDPNRWGLVFGSVGSARGVIAILAIMLYIFRAKLGCCKEARSIEYQNIENFLKNYGSLFPKRFKYHEIKKMTASFKIKLGQGGFGSVFKGNMDDGHPVAVKLFSISKGTGEEFINEVASISNTSHVNVVKLLGFCFEYNKRALVYEYMPEGSLEKFIFRGNPSGEFELGWPTLFKISVGIARGLEYLHVFCATRMVHFDIKPQNVLLDEDFCPKISDFGLAKLYVDNKSFMSLSGTRGTIGYIAPEVVCKNLGEVSHKSDVYSYGMMILEMVGGRKNSNNVDSNDNSQMYFPHWIYGQLEQNQEIVLPNIMNDDEKESARKMIIVSLWCIQTDPSQRPTMSRVVEMLEGNVDVLQIPPRPHLFSSANPSLADSSSVDFSGR